MFHSYLYSKLYTQYLAYNRLSVILVKLPVSEQKERVEYDLGKIERQGQLRFLISESQGNGAVLVGARTAVAKKEVESKTQHILFCL